MVFMGLTAGTRCGRIIINKRDIFFRSEKRAKRLGENYMYKDFTNSRITGYNGLKGAYEIHIRGKMDHELPFTTERYQKELSRKLIVRMLASSAERKDGWYRSLLREINFVGGPNIVYSNEEGLQISGLYSKSGEPFILCDKQICPMIVALYKTDLKAMTLLQGMGAANVKVKDRYGDSITVRDLGMDILESYYTATSDDAKAKGRRMVEILQSLPELSYQDSLDTYVSKPSIDAKQKEEELFEKPAKKTHQGKLDAFITKAPTDGRGTGV